MVESRKQAVSIRMNVSDVRKVKKLAGRLGVRDSDVIRFAVKSMLGRLGPLYDPEVRGRNLVPVFVEFGTELLRFFDLDGARLEVIVNEGVEPAKRVDRDDIALLALTGAQEQYAALKLSALNRQEGPQAGSADLASALRQYLYEKYVYRGNRNGSSHGADRGIEHDLDKNIDKRSAEARVLETLHLAVAGARHE